MEKIPCFYGWEVVRQIGRGHFGTVYELKEKTDESTGASAGRSAMKVISIPPRQGELDFPLVERHNGITITGMPHSQADEIMWEFKRMAQLQGHGNIVNCYEHEIVQNDHQQGWDVLIRMELLTSLFDYADGKAIEEKTAIRLGMDICRALGWCEKRNILHGNIKPQNIFVSKDGSFKLGDFGTLRFAEHITVPTTAGTFDYMPPEACSRPFHRSGYDKRGDIYSLGLVLYWLMNESRGAFLPLPPETYDSSDQSVAQEKRISGKPLPRPAHGSQKLQNIVLKACAFKPEERYQSAEELYNALSRLPGAEPISFLAGDPANPVPPFEEPEEAEEIKDGKTVAVLGAGTDSVQKASDSHKEEPAPKSPPKRLPLVIAAVCAVVLLVCAIGYFNCWLGHRWGDGTVTIEVSHTSPGILTYTCSVCGETRVETIAALTEHTYNLETVNAKYLKDEATCTEPAVYYKSCICGEVGTETFTYGSANGHRWGDGAVTMEVSHTSPGILTYTCSVCGQIKEETLAKLTAHTYDQEVASPRYLRSEATCTEPAVYYKSCICGDVGTETFPYGEANGHSWVDGVVTDTGTKTYICTICGETKEEATEQAEEFTEALSEDAMDAATEATTEASTEEPTAEASVIDSGTCGDDLTWELDDSGTLTISGSGDMYNYSAFNPRNRQQAPWYSYWDSIQSVVIEDGITSIGAIAFYGCVNLTSVTIPNSVTSIGKGAFQSCNSLQNVYYAGTESDRSKLTVERIGNGNESFLNAIWNYNSTI